MSIVKDEKELEYWSDQKLLEEAQTPTGRMPLFLIHTQIEKRKHYRDSANARKETPATSIYEEDVAEFGGGGLGSMQQQMPMSPPPNQQMPPPQQMPMSAGPQAGMGVAPMARGGLIRAQTGRKLPMENEASQVAAQGRYGDSTLVHMNPIEVAMMNRNGDLTTNPKTGLKEAWAPLLPLLMGAGRAGLGYMGRSAIPRSLAGMRSRLPWMRGPTPKAYPGTRPSLPPGAGTPNLPAVIPPRAGTPNLPAIISPKVPPGGGGGGGIGGLWGKYGPKAHPWKWGIGSGLATLPFVMGGGEDERTENYGGGPPPPDAGTVTTPSPNLTNLSEELYGTFLQPAGEYEKELTKAESYRRTPEQRKAEAQGIAYSGLAKALSNVGMENIISGVADVTPDVMALRKYQTEEERVVDKNVADLTRARRGDKATAMQAAMQWEDIKNKRDSYERSGELAIYDAALKAWQSQMNYGMPGAIPFEIYAHYYRTGEWLGSGGGSAQKELDKAGLTETE